MRVFESRVAGAPPESVHAYVETMLEELAKMSVLIGEAELAAAIEEAAALARVARGRAASGGSADFPSGPLTSGRA